MVFCVPASAYTNGIGRFIGLDILSGVQLVIGIGIIVDGWVVATIGHAGRNALPIFANITDWTFAIVNAADWLIFFIAGQTVELVGQYWADVGVQSVVKEVTPDEYRSAQSANKLDVMMWRKSQPLAIVLGNNELWVPPFENYFGVRTGMLWAEWVDSNGANGVEPPAYVKELISDINAFQSADQSSDEFKVLGERMVKNMV